MSPLRSGSPMVPSLKMITADAPCAWAFSTLTPKSQVPRWMTATLPDRLGAPAGESPGPQAAPAARGAPAGRAPSSQPACDALSWWVGCTKSMTAIGPDTEPLGESPIVAKSVFATHGDGGAGVADSVGGAVSFQTEATNGWLVTV